MGTTGGKLDRMLQQGAFIAVLTATFLPPANFCAAVIAIVIATFLPLTNLCAVCISLNTYK
jgi:hypothetical protein